MEINLILAIILCIISYVVLPSFLIFIFISNKKLLKVLSSIYFIVFLLGLSVLVFSSVTINSKNVVINFETNNKWFSLQFLWANLNFKNILLNIIMLFPVGAFIISLNTKHSFLKTLILSLVISLTIEFLQFVLPISRVTEFLDVILNCLSGIIGYLYFYLVHKFAKRYEINLLNKE